MPKAIECFNPELLGTPKMLSHSAISKVRTWDPLHRAGAVLCDASAKSTANDDFCRNCLVGGKCAIFLGGRPPLQSVFFASSVCMSCRKGVSVIGHISTHDSLHMNNDAVC